MIAKLKCAFLSATVQACFDQSGWTGQLLHVIALENKIAQLTNSVDRPFLKQHDDKEPPSLWWDYWDTTRVSSGSTPVRRPQRKQAAEGVFERVSHDNHPRGP